MNCYQHADRAATAYCRTCGRALCDEDQRNIYGVIYCQECLARAAGVAPAAPFGAGPIPPLGAALPPSPANHSPGLALVLGCIPGVGAVYNAQYLKAFLQVVIFGFLVSLHGDAAGLLCAAFWFYMVIDSYRVAKAISLGLPVDEMWGEGSLPVDLPLAAIILIGIGCLYLLRNFGWLPYNLTRFIWPAILIAVGLWLLERRRAPRLGDELPPPPAPPIVPPIVPPTDSQVPR